MGFKPRCFIGSSTEGLAVARAVQEELDHDAEVTLWNQDVFQLSTIAFDRLIRAIEDTDFAVFVFSADDVAKIRGQEQQIARDNVVFELGLAIGTLGRDRTFFLKPRNAANLRMPSDLAGLEPATFDSERSDGNLVAAVGSACTKMRRAFRRLGAYQASRATPISDPSQSVLNGMLAVAALTKTSFGPSGTRVSIESHGEIFSTRSAVSICESAPTQDRLAREGARVLLRLTQRVGNLAGGARKTAILLACRLIQSAYAAIEAGFAREDVLRGIADGSLEAADALRRMARSASAQGLQGVAATAALDQHLGQQVARAIEMAGPDGIIIVESVESPARVSLTATEGFTFDRGFTREAFINDPPTNSAVIENCLILLFTGTIKGLKDLLPALEHVARLGMGLVVIAEGFGDEALDTLALNQERIPSVAVLAPGYGSSRRAWMGDIAAYTGGRVVDAEKGRTLQKVLPSEFGRARLVRVRSDSTSIMDGAGSSEDILARASEIRAQIEHVQSEYQREKAQQRLAALNGSVVTVSLGGADTASAYEDRRCFTDGLHAAHAAIQSGVVAGGGVALATVANLLRQKGVANAAVALGREAIERSLEEPFRVLAASAGLDETAALASVNRATLADLGVNVSTRQVENLALAGILDAAGQLAQALEAAASTAKIVIETEEWLATDGSMEGASGESDQSI